MPPALDANPPLLPPCLLPPPWTDKDALRTCARTKVEAGRVLACRGAAFRGSSALLRRCF